MKWLNVLALFSIFTCLISLPASVTAKTLIATTLPYPPYEYMENDQPKGIAVEVIREVVSRMGTDDVEFQFVPWKRAVFLTENGKSDMLFNAGKNAERQVWGHYSSSVLILQRYVLFKRRGEPATVPEDYSGLDKTRIGIRRAYLYGSGPFRKALDSGKFAKISYTNSSEQSINQLLRGRIDMFVGDYLPVMHAIKQMGVSDQIDIVMAGTTQRVVLVWRTYVLFSKQRVDEDYVQRFSETMDEMKQDGSYQKIFDRYSH